MTFTTIYFMRSTRVLSEEESRWSRSTWWCWARLLSILLFFIWLLILLFLEVNTAEREKRQVDKKLLVQDNPNHWCTSSLLYYVKIYSYSCTALDKTVALKALEALEEILTIPSFSANLPAKLVLTGPLEGKTFEANVNASIIQCNDHPPFEKDAITYGRCAVLSFFDLFWCPILGCVISPKRKSILLYQDL